MKFDWKELLQVTSNIAILVGIVLVIVELQQNQTLTRAQFASETLINNINFKTSLVGDSPDKLIAKACFEPDLLTDEDKLRLNRLYAARLQMAQRNRFLEGIIKSGIDWETSFRIAFTEIISTQYGRKFHTELFSDIVSPLADMGNEILASAGPTDCLEQGSL